MVKFKFIVSTSFVIIIFLEYATCLFMNPCELCVDFVISSAAQDSHTHTNTVYDVQLLCWNHDLVSCWVLSAHIHYIHIHFLNCKSECNGNIFVVWDFVVFVYKSKLYIEIGQENTNVFALYSVNPQIQILTRSFKWNNNTSL